MSSAYCRLCPSIEGCLLSSISASWRLGQGPTHLSNDDRWPRQPSLTKDITLALDFPNLFIKFKLLDPKRREVMSLGSEMKAISLFSLMDRPKGKNKRMADQLIKEKVKGNRSYRQDNFRLLIKSLNFNWKICSPSRIKKRKRKCWPKGKKERPTNSFSFLFFYYREGFKRTYF